jgi:hypothetical protein
LLSFRAKGANGLGKLAFSNWFGIAEDSRRLMDEVDEGKVHHI